MNGWSPPDRLPSINSLNLIRRTTHNNIGFSFPHDPGLEIRCDDVTGKMSTVLAVLGGGGKHHIEFTNQKKGLYIIMIKNDRDIRTIKKV